MVKLDPIKFGNYKLLAAFKNLLNFIKIYTNVSQYLRLPYLIKESGTKRISLKFINLKTVFVWKTFLTPLDSRLQNGYLINYKCNKI